MRSVPGLRFVNVQDLFSSALSSMRAEPSERSILVASPGSGSPPVSQSMSTSFQPDAVCSLTV